MAETIGTQPRAKGTVRLATKLRDGQSEIDTFFQAGSLKCLFPRPRGRHLDAVLLNTAGGVTGGDEMRCDLSVGRGSSLTVTSQACERVYKAQPGEPGRVRNRVQVGAGARLNWLPQETILFDACNLDRRLVIDLDASARLLLVEPLVFGRLAMHETLTQISLSDRIEVRQDAQPVFVDRIRFEGDLAAHLSRPFVADGHNAMANIVFIHPAAEAQLDPVRALLPRSAGASLLSDRCLACRILARDSYELRKALLPILHLLNDDTIPRCWTL